MHRGIKVQSRRERTQQYITSSGATGALMAAEVSGPWRGSGAVTRGQPPMRKELGGRDGLPRGRAAMGAVVH